MNQMKRPQLKTYKFEIMKSPVPPQLLKVLSIRAQDAEEAYRSAYNRFHGRKWPSGPERLYAQVKTEKGRVIGVFIERFDRDGHSFTFGPFRREEPDIGE
jgi:hypothetical protein